MKLPDQVPVLQQLVLEQQHMIEPLKEQLLLMKRRKFGPRNEAIDVDQLELFASTDDASTMIEVVEQDSESEREETAVKTPVKREKAIRILKNLPREVQIVDIPDASKVCGCCGCALHRFGEECSAQLHYVPASLKIIETRRQQYGCGKLPR